MISLNIQYTKYLSEDVGEGCQTQSFPGRFGNYTVKFLYINETHELNCAHDDVTSKLKAKFTCIKEGNEDPKLVPEYFCINTPNTEKITNIAKNVSICCFVIEIIKLINNNDIVTFPSYLYLNSLQSTNLK